MMVMHTEGPITRVDDYYTFGLTFVTSDRIENQSKSTTERGKTIM
jgi:hypothetical protein